MELKKLFLKTNYSQTTNKLIDLPALFVNAEASNKNNSDKSNNQSSA